MLTEGTGAGTPSAGSVRGKCHHRRFAARLHALTTAEGRPAHAVPRDTADLTVQLAKPVAMDVGWDSRYVKAAATAVAGTLTTLLY